MAKDGFTMLNNSDPASQTADVTVRRKKSFNWPAFFALLFFLAGSALGYLGFTIVGSKNLAVQSIMFPWNPIEWDTLRDSPLSYRSLGDSGEFLPLYKNLLKDPSSIGYKPDETYFNSVLSLLKKNHVKKINDRDLLAGIEQELGKLFKESGIKEAPALSGYELNGTFLSRLLREQGKGINSGILTIACLRGLLRAVNDPYTVLMAPREYTLLQERLQEKAFGGVGIYIELDRENKNRLTVVEPIEGTPAFRAGIHGGDVIEKINDEATADMTLEGAVAKMRGPVGTEVTLSLRRKGLPALKEMKITRAAINVPSVSYRFLEGGVGYVRIRMFGTETARELERAIDNLKDGIRPPEEADPEKIREIKSPPAVEPVTSLILDLWNNGGGYHNAAVDISSKFVSPRRTVFKRLDGNGSIRDFHTVKARQVNLPLVVLVNRFSASSSEIVAGALKDNRAGTLMGDRTFGKGSVQQIYNLKEGCALKLTVSYFLTPTGKIINKKGLKPDIFVDMKPNRVGKNDDIQLTEAINFLKNRGSIGSGNDHKRI